MAQTTGELEMLTGNVQRKKIQLIIKINNFTSIINAFSMGKKSIYILFHYNAEENCSWLVQHQKSNSRQVLD